MLMIVFGEEVGLDRQNAIRSKARWSVVIMYPRNAGHRELLLSGLDKAHRSDSVSVLAPGPAVAFD
jgi:hypothetical protein